MVTTKLQNTSLLHKSQSLPLHQERTSEIRNTLPFMLTPQKMKYLGINLCTQSLKGNL
jgi:hypothetical protein